MSLVVPLEEIFASGKGVLSSHPSWERVELGEVCTILNGFPFKSAQFNKSSGFPIIRIRDLGRNRTETFYDGDFPREYIIHNGDLLVGMDGIFRCCEWRGGEAGLNQRVCKITPNEQFLNRKFLLYALNGYLKAIEDATSSVTVGHLSSRDILRIPFPLPPLEEQNRLAEKLEELAGKVGRCMGRLMQIPIILKRFRQSVLSAACSGRLTADWREQYPQVDSPQNDGREKVVFDFPRAWGARSFGEVTDSSFYGPRFSSESYSEQGVPTVRTTDMSFDGSIALKDAPCVTVSKAELEKYGLVEGDLVVTRTGATIGKCAVYDPSIGPAIPGAYLIRFRLKTSFIVPKYALLFLMSPTGQHLLVGGSTAVAQPNVNATTISGFVIPVPSILEQQEIIRRVESLFTVADQLEARYKKGKAYVDKLTQSILAKAFRGELVPQDPNDEPAKTLLERIRAGKQAGKVYVNQIDEAA